MLLVFWLLTKNENHIITKPYILWERARSLSSSYWNQSMVCLEQSPTIPH